MQSRVYLFESAHIWDLCALIAGSRGFAGTSLHARIVAGAFALPRVSFMPPDVATGGKPCKQDAYVAAWEMENLPGVVPLDDLPAGITQALSADPQQLAAHSARLARLCREGCVRWIEWEIRARTRPRVFSRRADIQCQKSSQTKGE